MRRNFVLCLFMHLVGRSNLCKCPLSSTTIEKNESQPSNIQITYISQKGNANIAGNGNVHYKTVGNTDTGLIESLKYENLILKQIVKNLESRDN